MKEIVVFGIGQFADAAWYYLTYFSEYKVVAYTVEEDYMGEIEEFHGRPVVPWEEIEKHHSPFHHGMLVLTSFRDVNRLRERLYRKAGEKGYPLISFVHPDSTICTDRIGDNCFITEHNTINPFVEIGDDVVIWSNNHIGHHTKIGDHCFISSECCISGAVTLGERVFVGVNATIRDNVEIGEGCIIGAGAVVTTSLPPDTVIVPARSVIIPHKSYELEKI